MQTTSMRLWAQRSVSSNLAVAFALGIIFVGTYALSMPIRIWEWLRKRFRFGITAKAFAPG